jgi:hypothetical protein
VNGKKVSVKSTKCFGQLLLLEKKDWNDRGEYIPNLNTDCARYDIFIFVRVSPAAEELMKKNKLLYVDSCDKDTLRKIIVNNKWEYDIPGFITYVELIHIIKNEFIIEKGSLLNGKTPMDAANYYMQTGDMYDISRVFDYL